MIKGRVILIAALLACAFDAPSLAQTTISLSSTRSQLLFDKADQEVDVGTIVCYLNGSGPIQSPLRLKWVSFAKLQLKVVSSAGYTITNIGALDKAAENMTGQYASAEAKMATANASTFTIFIDFHQGNSTSWTTRRFEVGTTGCR